MNRIENITKPLIWLTALLLAALAAGCGKGDPILGGTVVKADAGRPRVSLTVPADAAVLAPANAAITATFTESMAPATIIAANFTVVNTTTPGPVVATSVTYDAASRTAIFNHAALTAGESYTATITTGATDVAGNALAGNPTLPTAANNYVWTFTASAPDNTPPTITLTNPANVDTAVAVNSAINATFDKAMDPSTLSTTTFTLQVGNPPSGPALAGAVVYDQLSRIATFTPSSNLAASTQYTATVTGGIAGAKDLSGNALVAPTTVTPINPWTFTTGTGLAPSAIALGAAASFGIASSEGLTSTGVTVVNGDVALHPLATCSDATGGPGGAGQSCLVKTYTTTTGMTVNGSIFWAGDPFDSGATASKVKTDLNTAWNEGMTKANTQPAIAADELGGKIFIPGIYENANLGLAAGTVATLDAQGNANAVFIFKITLGGDLVDSGTLLLPSRIDLINGAQARNVWFIGGRDITIGSGTTWNGNILAHRTATVKDGSTVNGRVLAGAGPGGAGAITLTGAAAPSLTIINVVQ